MTNERRRRIISSRSKYLVLDRANLDAAAGFTSPRRVDAGRMVRVSDASSNLSVSGGKLQFAGSCLYEWTDPAGAYFTRKAGRTMQWTITRPTLDANVVYIGWYSGGSNNTHSMLYLSGNGYTYGVANAATLFYQKEQRAGIAMRGAIVLQDAGAVYLINTGTFWTRLWIDDYLTNTNLHPQVRDTNEVATLDEVMVRDLPSAFWQPSLTVTNPATATTYTLIDPNDAQVGSETYLVTFTAPNPLSGALHILINYLDASNYRDIFINSSGALEYDYYVGGAKTVAYGPTAGVVSAGGTYTFEISSRGDRARIATRDDSTHAWTMRIAAYSDDYSIVQSLFGLQPTIRLVYDAGWTPTRIIGYPQFSLADNAALGTYNTGKNLFIVGDSKSGAGLTTWDATLMNNLFTATGIPFVDTPWRAAIGGYTVALWAGIWTAQIAARSITPHFVICNLGANDVSALPAEAVWKANYGGMLDACHAKWPSAVIGAMKPGRRNYDAQCALLGGYIDDLLATRSWASTIGDETIWFKNNDNYTTLSDDGTHYNAAGHLAAAGVVQTWVLAHL